MKGFNIASVDTTPGLPVASFKRLIRSPI